LVKSILKALPNLKQLAFNWDGKNRLFFSRELSAGVYFIRLETSGYEKTEKIILLQ